MRRHPATSTLFPYTTLFRSLFPRAVALRLFAHGENLQRFVRVLRGGGHADGQGDRVRAQGHAADGVDLEVLGVDLRAHGVPAERSEEHTSELQSRENLVCRL